MYEGVARRPGHSIDIEPKMVFDAVKTGAA
jgi:hypothetical protein